MNDPFFPSDRFGIEVRPFSIEKVKVDLAVKHTSRGPMCSGFRIEAVVIDVENERRKIPIKSEQDCLPMSLEHYQDREFVFRNIQNCLYDMVTHEVDEKLLVDGKQLRNPHP